MQSAEDDYLMLSGLQHFIYCRRQWALIHVEQQWAENGRTVDGNLFHKKAHDDKKMEKRGDLLITRGLMVHSHALGISGICDVVEFHKAESGISLNNYDGQWLPYPVEYKRGEPKEHRADEAQLCAQAMCLEEMLACSIPRGSLFYGENRRRTQVEFTEELRDLVKSSIEEMQQYWSRGYTPKVKRHSGCNACSLKNLCLPALSKTRTVESYLNSNLGETSA